MVAALIRRGHDVTLYASDAGTIECPCRTFKTMATWKGSIRITPSMILARYDFDIIHLHNYYTFQNVAALLSNTKARVFLQPHGSFVMYESGYDNRSFMQRIIDPAFRRWFFGRVDGVICVSDREMNQAHRLRCPGIVKVPNGINMAEYADLSRRGKFRRQFGINPDEALVISIGRNHYLKGHDLLKQAMEGIDATLVMIGVDHPPLYGRDKLAALAAADLYVLPSRYDIFGITALEAMACGTPTLVTNDCGIAEYMVKSGNTSGNKGTLHDGIVAALARRDSEERRQQRREFAAGFDWSIIAEKMEAVYVG